MNVRVEYEEAPIRHIAVQCPNCEKWFNGHDITKDRLDFEYQIYSARFQCPVCCQIFEADTYNNYSTLHIEEISYPEIYKDCLERKVVWE